MSSWKTIVSKKHFERKSQKTPGASAGGTKNNVQA